MIRLVCLYFFSSVALQCASLQIATGPGTSAQTHTLQIHGAAANARLQILDGVSPVQVVTADRHGIARLDVKGLAPGKHQLRIVEWGSGRSSSISEVTVPVSNANAFVPNQILSTGLKPVYSVSGDLDGDGSADTLMATTGALFVLYTNGGSFGPPQKLMEMVGVSAAEIRDFNGDGWNDLALLTNNGTLTVLLNDGHGSFAAAWNSPPGMAISALATGDFNGDGIPDLVISNALENSVSVLKGNGDGSFEAGHAFPVGTAPRSVAVADLNGDGLPDLAVANFGGNNISVLLGGGSGGFQAALTSPAGTGPVGLKAGAFTRSGASDLALLNEIDGAVMVLQNDGAGNFHSTAVFEGSSFAAGDVNGDGQLDLLIQSGGATTLQLGNSDGTFSSGYAVPALAPLLALSLADLQADGRLDVVALDLSGTVSVLLGTETSPASLHSLASPTVGPGFTNGTAQVPVINTFTTSTSSVHSGQTANLTWGTSGATSIAITPGISGTGTFSSTLAAGSVTVTPPATAEILFDGDSLTCGLGASGSDCQFAKKGGVSECCGYPPLTISALSALGQPIKTWTNLGVSGVQAEPGQGGLSQPVPTCHASTNQPSIIAEWLGSNDLLYGRTPTEVVADLQARWVTLQNAGCKVAAFTLLQRPPSEAGNFTPASRAATNSLIKSSAAALGIPVVDLAADSRIGCDTCNTDSTYFIADLTHVNDLGSSIVASLAAPVIANLLDVTYKLTATNSSGNAVATADIAVLPATSPVSVPNVVGLTRAAASTAVSNANLVVAIITTATSGTVPTGSVISESPSAGTPVNSGSAINLVISTGSSPVAVPNVVGQTQAAATSSIQSAGLGVGTVTTGPSSTVPSGDVISQNPASGTQVGTGTTVNMVVSIGSSSQVAVPNVVGQTQAAATSNIQAAGLVAGTVTSSSSSTVPSGSVISESPSAGTQVNSGSAVNLVVSTGASSQVAVPNVVGQTQAAATSSIQASGLVVGAVSHATSSTVPSGSVISESPSAGTQVSSGSSVNLVVSTGPAQVSVPNVVGQTQAGATSNIQAAGLVVGTVTPAPSSTVPSGNVISENPSAGTQVNSGSSVNLVVSSGPPPGVLSRAGIFRSGYFWLEDVDGNQAFNSPPDRSFAFGGISGDIPITGDWTGNGITKVGIFRPGNGLFILDSNGNGQFDAGDAVYNLGLGVQPGDIPVVGDWNGDGRTKIGLFRQGYFWILDFNGNGTFDAGIDKTYAFGGVAGDIPIVGDWTGSGPSKIGLFRQGYFWILDSNGNGSIDNVNLAGGDQAFAFGGITGDVPVVGDWNGNGATKVGVFRKGFYWVLDANGNHQFDGTGSGLDLAFAFGGLNGDVPVVGKW